MGVVIYNFSASTFINYKQVFVLYIFLIQGDLRIIMSLTNFVMQPTIHVPHTIKKFQCNVGCITNFFRLIITRESPSIAKFQDD
jgi:hypothetical protein